MQTVRRESKRRQCAINEWQEKGQIAGKAKRKVAVEEWRADYGDQIIPRICETEFGCSRYREMADEETAEKQKEGI